jgi:mediator of RNA polymerase II transcription subunit 5
MDSQEVNITLAIFQKIILSNSDSQGAEAQNIRRTVIATVSQHITRYMRKLIRQRKLALFESIHGVTARLSMNFRRTALYPCPDLQPWNNGPGSIKQALRTTFQGLVSWSSNLLAGPAKYTARQIHVTTAIIGAPAVVSVLLTEIKNQPSTSETSTALDIAAALICSPAPGNMLSPPDWLHASNGRVGRMSLREALKLEAETAARTAQTDTLHALAAIRLHRRVDAQLAIALQDIAAPIMADLVPMTVVDVAGAVEVAVPDDVVKLDDSMMVDVTGMGGDGSFSVDMGGDAGDGMDLFGTASGMGDDDFFKDLKLDGTDYDMEGY